jgi:glycosyltransferase involved in cell wall biosynthesis
VIIGPRGWGDLGPRLTGGDLPDGVILGGSVGDDVLAGLYASARVFAYVPLSEGYGLPPAEAMNFGVPVVASLGVPSVIARPGDGLADDQRPAIRVDPLDTEAIADGLLVAALDEVQRQSLITAGAAMALSRTWHRSALGHLELWNSLL